MTISRKSAKDKARRLQKYVRDKILEVFPWLTEDDVRSTPMGVNGEDVQLSPLARQDFPYYVECKAKNRFAIYKLYDQAKNEVGHQPLLFIKQDRREPLVIMDADYFFKNFVEKK